MGLKDKARSGQKARDRGDALDFHKFLIDSLPVAVVTVSSDLLITGFNSQAEKITGYGREEASGRFCGDILQGGMCNISCPLRSALGLEGPVMGIETTIRNRSGKVIPVRMSTSGLFDHGGNLIGGVEAFQDISRLKALERERSAFVSMLAHDMKSPIIGIHGFAHRLLKKAANGRLDEKQAGYLKIIEQEAAKLESLIDEFLEFSRLQSGRLKLNLEPTSLDKELYELYEAYQLRVEERGLNLDLESEEPLPIIQADPARLRRVFRNMLDNAIKFTAGKGRIVVAAEETEKEVVIKVKDNGAGIKPSDLPHLFEPFYRGQGEGRSGGFGLGLAGAKAIVESHGGRISVESELGKGSVFTVALPKGGARKV